MSADPLKSLLGNKEGRQVFGAWLLDQETIDVVKPVIAERGWPTDRIQEGGIDAAVRALAVSTSPEYLIIDLSKSENPEEDVYALADVCSPGTALLAIGLENDVQLYRSLLNAGVHDYLLKPLTVETLRDAIGQMIAAMEEPEVQDVGPVSTHKTTAFIGVRGGVGTSTIATSCAYTLSQGLDRSVAFLDLDLQFGTSALEFDLEPGRGLTDALDNPTRVDDLFIQRAILKESEKLSLLAAESPLLDVAKTDPTAVSHLIEVMKETAEQIIIDMPRFTISSLTPVLNELTDIYLIADLTLAATRDTIRLMAFIGENAPDAKIHLVINKHGCPGNEVSLSDYEASVEAKADWLIPHDPKALMMASKKGRPITEVEKTSKVGKAIEDIAREITGLDNAGTATGFLSKFFRAERT
jgi:pilus assembly protein CpaE